MTLTDDRLIATDPTRGTDASPELSAGTDVQLDKFEALVRRLSKQSVDKHFDAYADIAWDDPEYIIDPSNPRWADAVHDGLRETEWFKALPPETQAELGLYMVASFMKIGLQFESVLKRGLLEFATTLPNGDPKFRYVYHEVIEEGHHAMMFQEFVNRTGFDIVGLPPRMQRASRRIVAMGRWFPELFFMFVIGGEDPIDHVQREAIRNRDDLPPVMERIIRIHITEEARHLSFARNYLKLRSKEIGPFRRAALGVGTPLILGVMAQMMMRPSPAMIRKFDIPREAIREAYTQNTEHQARTLEALRKIRKLSRELKIVNPATKKIWQALGIWSDQK
jgi:hypothetical protein